MFDPEQAIAEWRRQMRAAGIKAPAVIEELESHLRDEIAGQIRSGSDPAQAFDFAMRQIGPAGALKAEFARAYSPSAAQLRQWGAIAYSVELTAYTLLQTRQLLKSAPTHQELSLGIAGLAATLFIAYAIWRVAPWVMGLIANKTIRSLVVMAACVSGLGWMAIFAWFILPYVEFTPGQFAVAFLWALLPLVTLPALLVGLDQPEREPVR